MSHSRTPQLSGREAAHLLRIIAIAREREMALLPALAAAAPVEDRAEGRRLRDLLADASEENLTGLLHDALARGRDAPAARMLKALIRIGLPAEGLRELARWLSSRATYRHSFFRAVAYPFTLMITGSLVYLVAFHGFAMPILMDAFGALFAGVGARLPLLTSAFITLYDLPGRALTNPLTGLVYALAVLLVCGVCLRWGLRFTDYRISLALPYAGPYLRFEAARSFTEALSLLLSFSVPLPEAVRLAADTVASPVLRDRLRSVADRVADGDGLGECLRAVNALPASASWRLWSAYYRSALEEELPEVAASCNRELEVWEFKIIASSRFIAGGVAVVMLAPVALAVIAMYLPMFSLISLI